MNQDRTLLPARFIGLFFVAVGFILHGMAPVPLQAQEDGTIFVDVSESAGIVDNRRGTDKAIGQAWGDYNNDGWPDLYVTDHAGPNTLYQNNGDGTFSVSPFNSKVILPERYSTGANFVDYDNDGWKDLLVLAWGKNSLFRNLEGEGFTNVTAAAGLNIGERNSKTASWGDFNQDGHLDLYIANWACYPMCGRQQYGETDKLYQNNGDGTFTDVTKLLGSKITGSGFVASFTDYDNDGDLDIYLVNDEFINPIRNVLWRNDGPGCDGWCFTEIAEEMNADIRMMGMGLATADYDNDGDQDFYISNVSHMVLLENLGDGSFADSAADAGVDSVGTVGWGNLFFDYDNDGWQDIYLAVSDAMGAGSEPRSPLYRNQQDGTFADMTSTSGVSEPGRTLGVAAADYNRDGRVDLLIGDFLAGYQLFENQSNTGNNWLAVELIGSGTVNRDAVGSRVTLTTADGLTQMREVISGSGLGSGNGLILHFGLGQSEVIDQLIIRWPDGSTQTIQGVGLNRYLLIERGAETETTEKNIEGVDIYAKETVFAEPILHEFALGNLQMLGAILGVLAMMFLAIGGLYRPE